MGYLIFFWRLTDYCISLLYLYFEYRSDTEWLRIGLGLVLVPLLFWYISHLTSFYSQYICHISIKVYGIYFGNKWLNYHNQNQSKTNPKTFQNQLKNSNIMIYKLYSCELESKWSRCPNMKIMNTIPWHVYFIWCLCGLSFKIIYLKSPIAFVSLLMDLSMQQ